MSHPVVLVTGASRGLGHTIAKLILATPDATFNVVTVARSPLPTDQLLGGIDSGRVAHLQADISTQGIPASAVKLALDKYGRLDAVVINHGVLDPVAPIVPKGGEDQGDVEAWRSCFEINFFSAVDLVKVAVPVLRKTKGRIIFVSSGASSNGYYAWGAYSASKAAMNSLCRTLAEEEPDITSISVRPGIVDTQMQREIREIHGQAMGKTHSRFTSLHQSGKLLQPEQPGGVIANLAMRASKELSGQYVSWDAEELKGYR